jgi:uncharacterized membrane-anchored protein YhcB (DUF1043 family)
MDDSFNQRGEPYLFDQISNDYGISKQKLQEELEQRTALLEWLQERGVKNFDKVSEIIKEYYKNKEEILKMINSENSEYTLEDVIKAESKIDLSHRDQLDNAMEKDQKEHNSSEELETSPKLDSSATIGQKKSLDNNPVAEIEKRLKSEEQKVDSMYPRTPEEKKQNPFKNSGEETNENPFEA